MADEQIHNEHIHRDEVIIPDLSKKASLDNFCKNMQNHIKSILSWQYKEGKWDDTEKDSFLDELPKNLKIIDAVKEKKLSPLDTKFLTLMERYYFVLAHKPELKTKDHPQQYATYLSTVKNDIWTFYLECMVNNNYDIANNPIQEIAGVPEIVAICNFFEKKYQDNQWHINWEKYYDWYFTEEGTRLFHLLEKVTTKYSVQQKPHINIPLFFAIFDLNNSYSTEILFHMLIYFFNYSEKEISERIKDYKRL